MNKNHKLSGAEERLVIPWITAQFKRAALVCGYGHEDEDHAMQRVGFRAIRRNCQTYDAFGPEARILGLVPLLEDPDPRIRVMAATCLTLVLPEKAIPVLEHLEKYEESGAGMQALHQLRAYRYGKMRWINGLD